jgi:hypothetical protein
LSVNNRACADCGAAVGSPHTPGCDVARCLVDGEQRLRCFARHDCGQDVWTGRWPGDVECAEFGWWVQDRCAEGLGFVRCAADAPGAVADLNRLHWEAVWDRTAGRWRRREARGLGAPSPGGEGR